MLGVLQWAGGSQRDLRLGHLHETKPTDFTHAPFLLLAVRLQIVRLLLAVRQIPPLTSGGTMTSLV